MTSRTLLPAAAAVLTLALLAGCSATSAAPPVASTASTAVTAPPTPATGSSAPAAAGTAICGFATAKQVDAALHPSPAITEADASTYLHGEPICGYTSDDHASIIVEAIFWPDLSGMDFQSGEMSADALTPVSGVGDRAAIDPQELDIAVGSRGLSVETAGTTDLTGEQLTALGKLAVKALR